MLFYRNIQAASEEDKNLSIRDWLKNDMDTARGLYQALYTKAGFLDEPDPEKSKVMDDVFDYKPRLSARILDEALIENNLPPLMIVKNRGNLGEKRRADLEEIRERLQKSTDRYRILSGPYLKKGTGHVFYFNYEGSYHPGSLPISSNVEMNVYDMKEKKKYRLYYEPMF